MKKLLVMVLLLFLLPATNYQLLTVHAHTFGQAPFFKINNQYATLYPVPVTSLYNFNLPQDQAPQNYLVNQSISFEIDKTRLPAPPEVIEKTKFDWDFADGTHLEDLKNEHKYTKIGSYLIRIYVDEDTTPKPQIIESVLVNILPSKDYQLPKAVILANKKGSKDPLTDILQFNFKNPIYFECDQEKDCFWDFGDQKSAQGPTQTHQYPSDLSQVFVVLRVKDKNGFISDNFVEIQNSQNGQDNIATASALPKASSKKPNQLSITLGVLSTAVVAAILLKKRIYG